MCEQCRQFDAKILRYRSFVAQGLDSLTTERINGLIQELQQRKAALRCSSPETKLNKQSPGIRLPGPCLLARVTSALVTPCGRP
jgi:hypothetical protein